MQCLKIIQNLFIFIVKTVIKPEVFYYVVEKIFSYFVNVAGIVYLGEVIKSYSCSKMCENRKEIRYIFKLLYKKGRMQATKDICKVYGNDAISVPVDVRCTRSGRSIIEKVMKLWKSLTRSVTQAAMTSPRN